MKRSESITQEILTICNFAEFTMNGRFNIIGVYDQQMVDRTLMLWPHGFVVFRIKTNVKNVSKKIRLKIINETSGSILDVILSINIGSNGRANFLFEFANVKIQEFGVHKIVLSDPDDNDAYIGDTEVTIIPGAINEKETGKKSRVN